jgi:hypothetical protein
MGTFTNEQGEFVLQLPSGPARLSVRCLGYQPQELAVPAPSDSLLIIKLLPQPKMLGTVVVRPGMSPLEMAERAVAHLPRHQPAKPYEQRAFYRHALQVDGQYAGLGENVGDVLNGGYQIQYGAYRYSALPTDQTYIEHQRLSDHALAHDKEGKVRPEVNLYDLLYHKKKLLHNGFLTSSDVRKATFSLDSTFWENGREVLVLGFAPKRLPKPDEKSSLAQGRGRVYLYADNWAIFRIEAEAILPEGKQTHPLTLHQTQYLTDRLVVQFAPYQGQYYLQSVQYQADYDDYGWGAKTPRRVQVRASVWMENLQLRPLTEAEYVAKYGAYDQYGAVRVGVSRGPQPVYDPAFWEKMPPTPHFAAMRQDLEKSGRPLAQQFAHNRWNNLIKPEDSLAIVRQYSRQYQAFLRNH